MPDETLPAGDNYARVEEKLPKQPTAEIVYLAHRNATGENYGRWIGRSWEDKPGTPVPADGIE